MSSDMHIATMMAERKTQERERGRTPKKILVFTVCRCLMFVSACNLLYQTMRLFFLLFVFSGLRRYFCLPRDVSGWTRSATLRGGQVSKKRERKTL